MYQLQSYNLKTAAVRKKDLVDYKYIPRLSFHYSSHQFALNSWCSCWQAFVVQARNVCWTVTLYNDWFKCAASATSQISFIVLCCGVCVCVFWSIFVLAIFRLHIECLYFVFAINLAFGALKSASRWKQQTQREHPKLKQAVVSIISSWYCTCTLYTIIIWDVYRCMTR